MKQSLLLNDILEIVKLYEKGFSVTLLSKQFGVSRKTIDKKLKKYNVQKRKIGYKQFIDENLFNKIDNEFKAYFLGFMYADGCVHGNCRISITLAEKDKIILDIFNQYIAKGKINLKENKSYNFIGLTGKEYVASKSYGLHLTSVKIFNDMVKLGCTPRKSLILKFPGFDKIPQNLFHHFIRGYFDGDGCITLKKNQKIGCCAIKIISSYDFCFGLKEFLKNIGIESIVGDIGKVAAVRISKKSDILRFYKYIYKNSTMFLDRKKQKFNLHYLKSNVIVTINGVEYKTKDAAAIALGVSRGTIRRRCFSDKYPNYQFSKNHFFYSF